MKDEEIHASLTKSVPTDCRESKRYATKNHKENEEGIFKPMFSSCMRKILLFFPSSIIFGDHHHHVIEREVSFFLISSTSFCLNAHWIQTLTY
jgi:hypothetical protein